MVLNPLKNSTKFGRPNLDNTNTNNHKPINDPALPDKTLKIDPAVAREVQKLKHIVEQLLVLQAAMPHNPIEIEKVIVTPTLGTTPPSSTQLLNRAPAGLRERCQTSFSTDFSQELKHSVLVVRV